MYRRTFRQVLGNLAVFRTLAEAREHPAGRIGLGQNLDARLVPELFHEPEVFRKGASLADEVPDGKGVGCGQPIHRLAVLLEESEAEAALGLALAARAAQMMELVQQERQERQES